MYVLYAYFICMYECKPIYTYTHLYSCIHNDIPHTYYICKAYKVLTYSFQQLCDEVPK